MQGREGCRWRRGRGSLTFLSPDYIFLLFWRVVGKGRESKKYSFSQEL